MDTGLDALSKFKIGNCENNTIFISLLADQHQYWPILNIGSSIYMLAIGLKIIHKHIKKHSLITIHAAMMWGQHGHYEALCSNPNNSYGKVKKVPE